MRMLGAGLGLVSLLVVVGIYAGWFAKTQVPVIEKGQEAKKQVEPLSGRGPDGKSAAQSVEVEPQMRGGQTHGLKVTSVAAGGYFDTYFSLQKDDLIVQIGESNVDSLGGPETAEAMLHTPAQYQKLIVVRGGQKVELTATGAAAPGQNNVKIPLH